MKPQLKIIYFLSIFPLLTGSLTLGYWFFKRTWFALNANIESLVIIIVVGFLLFAPITIILCIVFVVKNRSEWKKIIIPIAVVGLTFSIFDFYQSLYASLNNQAFIRIINDTDKQVNRIWSDNFEMNYSENKMNDFVISFYPVYTYDWIQEYSKGVFNYKINPLHIDLKQKGSSIITYNMPNFSKGDCETIRLSEIIKPK